MDWLEFHILYTRGELASCTTFFRHRKNLETMRNTLISALLVISLLSPMLSVAETATHFDKTYFDRNGDGLDDRMDHLIDDGSEISVILLLNSKPTDNHFREIEDLGLNIDHVYKYIDAIRIDKVPASLADDLTKISDLRIVEWQAPVYAFLDTAVKAIKVRESEEYSPVVWDKELFGEGINVAVLDTGVDNEHETFGDYDEQGVRRFIAGMDCDGGCPTDGSGNYQFTTEEDSNEDPDDFDGHGTHVASTVLGTGGDTSDGNSCESDDECVGVAPAARLIDMKVMADWGSGSAADINEAIEACIENVDTDWENDGAKNNGIQIMSMSLGTTSGSDGSDSQSQLVNQANAAGIAVIIAMGNDGDEEVPSPAAADWSIAVGAMDNNENVNRNDDDLASYSNYGPRDDDGDSDRWDELKPSVVAPGSDIRAALGHSNLFGDSNAQGWTTQSGTSMATPIVAGLAALLLEADGSLAPTSNSNGVRERLQQYSEAWDGTHDGSPSEPDESDKYNYYYGYGYIDGYEIVNINQPDAVVTDISTSPESPVEGDLVTVSVTVQNQGNIDIDEGKIKLIIDGDEVTDDDLDSIEVNSDYTWTYEWEPEEGEYEIEASVYEIAPEEGDTDNNNLEKTVVVDEAPAEGVDLVILDVWTDDDNTTDNEHINIYAKIKNQGTEKADSFEIRWYDDSSRFLTLEGTEIDVDEQNTISGQWVAEEGESKLEARIVDVQPEDQNENNNGRSFMITVGPPPEEPDFSPANLRTEGILEENQEIDIIFDILNLGKTAGEIDFELTIDNEEIYSGTVEIEGEESVTESYSWTAIEGNFDLIVTLDNSNPTETSEQNNLIELELEIEKSAPKFELISISWEDPVYKDEKTLVSVSVENYGGEDGNVKTTLYADDVLIDENNVFITAGNTQIQTFEWMPTSLGKKSLRAQINYEDKEKTKNAYVLEPETENEMPIPKVNVMINGIQAPSSLSVNVYTSDVILFSASDSTDDGKIVYYEWEIKQDSSTIFQGNQETLEYVFTEAGIYSSILTVTDNDGAKSTWQTSIIVTQKEVNTNNQQTDDEVNPLIIGGGMAGVLALGGYGALRYLRTEDEDDFFDFGEPEAVNLSCPSCGGLISITTTQRPIQVGCPMCQGQFIVRE